MDAMACGKLARHDSDSAGRTHRAIDCEVLKIGSLFCHLVDARRLAERAAVNAQIAISPIVREDEYDVWSSSRRFLRRGDA